MLHIDNKEFTFETSRSGGPGGQHVNKVATRVTLCFDVRASQALSSSLKQRILNKLSGRINAAGLLRVTSRKHRSQAANKKAAIRRFHELLEQALAQPKRRVATRKSASSVRRRLESKNRRGQVKLHRRKPEPDE